MAEMSATLEFYRTPGPMTDLSAHRAAFEEALTSPAAIFAAVQGTLIHRDWAALYGVKFSTERVDETHIRRAADRLVRILELEPGSLTKTREPERRSVGTCRDFTLMAVAMLRAAGTPARARCGFGTYFSPRFEDHWVVELWQGGRWRLADAQIDEAQKKVINPDFDLHDIPRDKFVVAGDAWQLWRTGQRAGSEFGIMDIRGASFIAGNLVHDFAALNKIESLPWDVWGPMTRGDDSALAPTLALFDHLAELGREAPWRFDEICALYEADAGLRVPPVVFNAVRQREERF
jgi:hypothetical protein